MEARSKYYQRAYERLRNTRPTGVGAIVGDGEVVDLSVKRGASKGKWDRVLAAAQKLHAEGLQLYDADGGLLEVVELEEPKPKTLARTDDGDDHELAIGVAQFAKVMDIALNAADRAVGRQNEHMNSVLEAALSLMKIATERLERTERSLDKILRAHAAMLEHGGGAGKPSVMDDFTALLAAAKASGFDVEKFFGTHGGNGAELDADDFDDSPAITPDHISAPRKQ